jgi:putative sterol carrier protein
VADIDLSNFASDDPKQFAHLVKGASTEQLTALMKSDQREKVLSEIFGRMPMLFRADRAGTTNAVVHWTIGDRADGGGDTYALSVGGADFLKVVTGNANPVMLFMTGKLKAKGDLGLAAKIGDLFDIPKA